MNDATATVQSPLVIANQGGVVTVTLNRPTKRNALSCALLTLLETTLGDIAVDRTARVVVIQGRGSAFCAGHDIEEMFGRSEKSYAELFALCSRVMLQLRRLPQPVIARVHGVATAAGCQLVAACDLAVAAEGATFATPGVKIGLFCTTPMVPLIRAIAPRAAMEMLLTGEPITARRAHELGLVNRVVNLVELDKAVQEYIDAILSASPLVVQLGKAAFYEQVGLSEVDGYQRATDVMTHNAIKPDAQEGMHAFLEKRKPKWTGA